jgi:hypothetical protein
LIAEVKGRRFGEPPTACRSPLKPAQSAAALHRDVDELADTQREHFITLVEQRLSQSP